MKTDCELDTLLLDTYEKYQPILHGKKISLKVVLPEEPLSICKCDSARISQVLGILLDNGASYVPAGGRMEMGVKKRKYFQLYVQDNGREFLMRIRRLYSEDFTGLIRPERRNSILDLDFALPGKL